LKLATSLFFIIDSFLLIFTQPHANALPAFGRDKFNASIFKGEAHGGKVA